MFNWNALMHQILDSHKEEQIVPLFRLGFRPFFLFGALFAAVAMLLWLGQINVFLMFLILLDLVFLDLLHPRSRLRGIGVGIAAGL